MNKNLVVIGTPVIDYYAAYSNKVAKKYKIEKGCTNYFSSKKIKKILKELKIIRQTAGDNAKNVAVAYKLAGGKSAAYLGVVGTDPEAKMFKKSLKKYGIIDKTISKIGSSGKILCLIDKNKERTFIANLAIGKSSIKADDKLLGAKIFFCTNITLLQPKIGPSTIRIIKKLKKHRTKIAISLESSNLIKKNIKKTIEFCSYADYLFLNEQELKAFGKEKRKIYKLHCIIFLKLGPKGAIALKDGKIIAKQNAIKVKKIADLTGAGDFFAGGALAAIEKNEDIKKVLKNAALSAAKIIQKIGVEP
ncbi:MAG: carbohydrate kinase family protein [Candidatus Micrarchaeota archaeon]|nr:carbohydrate kinase family protein [Candidatus Micrarchaeota archaeon]